MKILQNQNLYGKELIVIKIFNCNHLIEVFKKREHPFAKFWKVMLGHTKLLLILKLRCFHIVISFNFDTYFIHFISIQFQYSVNKIFTVCSHSIWENHKCVNRTRKKQSWASLVYEFSLAEGLLTAQTHEEIIMWH